MTPPLDALLKAAREVVAHDKAMTPGPWKSRAVQHRDDENQVVAEHAEVTDDEGGCIVTVASDLDGSELLDAAGIAHARTAAPQLAEFVLGLESHVEALRGLKDDMRAAAESYDHGRSFDFDAAEEIMERFLVAVAQARSVAP